jgi:4-hydroxy-tetrahydrodipicolinate synthase
MNSNFIGTGVAVITPFNQKNEVDYESLGNLLTYLIEGKSDYLVIHGTTGESATTTIEEKEEILRFVIEQTTGRIPIVYGIGGNNTKEVTSLLDKTDFTGITGILSISPYYNKPSQEGIFQHYKSIAAASPVPVLLYNVPGRTGSNIAAKTTVRLSFIDNIAGIKEANGDLTQSIEIIKNASEGFLLISGDDMLTLPIISLGGKGAISVLANAYPAQFSQMVKYSLNYKFKEALALLKPLSGINNYMYEEGNPVGIKQVLKNLGICEDFVRLPLVKASENLKKMIALSMQEIK